MEEESWAGAEGEIKLDGESPLVISLSLWDDFMSNDAVVRSLFPPSPSSSDLAKPAFHFEKPGSPERSSSWDVISDCSRPPLKRRCCDKDALEATPASSAWGENKGCSVVDAVENLASIGLSSPASMCFVVADEPLRSVDDVEEQSAESWMAGCIGESDTSDVQQIPPPHPAYTPIDTLAMSAKASGTAACGSRRASRNTLVGIIPSCKRSMEDPGKIRSKRQADKKLSPSVHANENAIRRAHDGKTGLATDARESAPVLAYPFALLKPSGIQGDVTLQDINHRINMVPSATRTCSNKDPSEVLASLAVSGKSVVALTTIQTEGKGTITIMRTRS